MLWPWGRHHLPSFASGFLRTPHPQAARLFTLLQFPTRHDEHGLREHLRAGTGLLATTQPSSLPVLQRTVLQIAPTPQVTEHCKTPVAACSAALLPAGPAGLCHDAPNVPSATDAVGLALAKDGAQQKDPWGHSSWSPLWASAGVWIRAGG